MFILSISTFKVYLVARHSNPRLLGASLIIDVKPRVKAQFKALCNPLMAQTTSMLM